MIDPKELRIGNLVSFKNALGEAKYMHVEDIHEMEIGCNGGGYDPDSLEPIEITEEWLIKLGLKSEGLLRFTKGLYSVVFMTDGTCYFQIAKENIASIKYVHQLQNLFFALTGQELELK